MNQQPLNLRRSIGIVRRYKALIGVVIVIGMICGAAYSVLAPPKMTSQTLIIIPTPKPNIETQQTIASSVTVLSAALVKLGSPMSLGAFADKVTVSATTPNVLSVTATDQSAGTAAKEANAVADAYISYVGGPDSPLGSEIIARVLVPATSATGTSLGTQLVEDAGAGLLAGALIGYLLAISRSRSDRRLRTRDDIANSVGIPVIASVLVDGPTDAVGWAKLFDSYQAGPVNSWRLRAIVDRLGVSTSENGTGVGHRTFVVLSLSTDREAAAIGPQLAAFAASIGIRTVLVIGPMLGMDTDTGMRAAAATHGAAESSAANRLQVVVPDDVNASWRQPDAALTVVVAVVDSDAPLVPPGLRTATTVLAVSPGVATTDQLARTAAAVTMVGGRIDGVVVGNPETDDTTSGLGLRQIGKPIRDTATRLNGVATEARR